MTQVPVLFFSAKLSHENDQVKKGGFGQWFENPALLIQQSSVEAIQSVTNSDGDSLASCVKSD